MEKAKIYQPTRSVMQAGAAKSSQWILEYTPKNARYLEPLMGWVGTNCTKNQCQLRFETLEKALAYANSNDIAVEVIPAQQPVIKPKSYSANFSANRVQ